MAQKFLTQRRKKPTKLTLIDVVKGRGSKDFSNKMGQLCKFIGGQEGIGERLKMSKWSVALTIRLSKGKEEKPIR